MLCATYRLKRDFTWFNTEPKPLGLSDESAKAFNYNIFSCRTGNIYTTSLLRQWTEWALEIKTPPSEVWEKDGRYFDPFRPVIEPAGFTTPEEMLLSRQHTIKQFLELIINVDVFVFTLGLTESWFNKEFGYEYPMCPGTAAGEFDAENHVFRNQDFSFVRDNLNAAINLMRSVNPNIRFLLTVSPVPLTATYSGKHVLVATMESKSILRAAAQDVANGSDNTTHQLETKPNELIRNGQFKFGSLGWISNDANNITAENSQLIQRHKINNAFSGIKQLISTGELSGKVFAYDIVVGFNDTADPNSKISVDLSSSLSSTMAGIKIGEAIKKDSSSIVFSGTTSVGWKGNIYLWIGSRTKGATIEIHSVSIRAIGENKTLIKQKIDYFPSYEIINSPCFRGGFFEPNQRSVNHVGVDFVMDSFFCCLNAQKPRDSIVIETPAKKTNEDIICEEQILEAFS